MKVNDRVKALTSKKEGEIGTIVGIVKTRALPIAVKFDDDVADCQWDFKEEELQVVGEVIDLEPKWEDLLRGYFIGSLKPTKALQDDFIKAIRFADIVRQAQKRGDKKVIFDVSEKSIRVFVDDGKDEVQK